MIKKIFFAAVLLVCAQAAMADNVLYAQVEGTNMTLKYGEKPADSGSIKYYQFDGTAGWNSTFYGTITTATVDASCADFNGNSTRALFNGFSKLTVINDIGNLNTANVEDMYSMFAECSSLTTLDLRSMNTAKVTNMALMFYQCSGLTSLRVSKFNTANVTNMLEMFQQCSSLAKLNLSEWNTAKVKSMTRMFQGCSNLVTIFVGPEWNTDAVTSDELMFYGCSNIRGINGTTYDSSKMDKTYARIDEGGENKGYMSGGTLLGNMSGGTLKANLAEGRRWATWYCQYRTYVIDEDEEAEAYTAEYDPQYSCMTLHKLGKVIPADHAVIIVSDKDNKNVVMTFDNAAHADNDPKNDLWGFDSRYTQEQAKHVLNNLIYHIDSYSGEIYMMGMVNGNFGFYRYTGEYTPFYKAMLFIPSGTGSRLSAISLAFSEEVTGIKEVYVDEGQAARNKVQGDDVWYTINGMRLNGKPSAPGLYINNGKKVIIN